MFCYRWHSHRWIAACSELPQEEVINGQHKFNTKIVHKYLPPVDVEVGVNWLYSQQDYK
jgi:hypothetical protein